MGARHNGSYSNVSEWTPERVARLEQLRGEGWSNSEIGADLGVTRNSIIGKSSRLGLVSRVSVRDSSEAMNRRIKAMKAPPVKVNRKADNALILKLAKRAQKAAECPPMVSAPIPQRDEPPGLVGLLGLKAHMCKWPIGELPDLTFCGQKIKRGPYCTPHAQRAFQPPKVKATPKSDAAFAAHMAKRFG
jgi:GcrA cell cycle regulator